MKLGPQNLYHTNAVSTVPLVSVYECVGGCRITFDLFFFGLLVLSLGTMDFFVHKPKTRLLQRLGITKKKKKSRMTTITNTKRLPRTRFIFNLKINNNNNKEAVAFKLQKIKNVQDRREKGKDSPRFVLLEEVKTRTR